MQLGFDMVYHDPVTQETVPWALPSKALLAEIAEAKWKVTDIETTGLTPYSEQLNFSGKELRRGVNPILRLRVNTVLYPQDGELKVVGFDFDQLTVQERRLVCEAVHTNAVFGHNVGFDAFWIQDLADGKMPTLLLDSMLLARALRPDAPLVLAKMCNDENEDSDFRAAAESVFIQGKSGWALADLSLALLRKMVDKGKQGPKNWAEPFLTQEAYNYATGDSRTTYELLMKILEPYEGEDLLEKYMNARNTNPVVEMLEPQVADIVAMRKNGMPWSEEEAERYALSKIAAVKAYAKQMCEIEPALEKYLLALSDVNAGIKVDLKTAMGEAFRNRGLDLDTTEKTGLPKVGEKDLRKAKAQESAEAIPLFDAWVGLSKAKKTRQMALEVTKFAKRGPDGRIHSLTSHGPVTGRLASKEPNSQQFPSVQEFRNCVAAPIGSKMVASDYSALDMRVGAALAIRAQKQIVEACMGDRQVDPDVLQCIARVLENRVSLYAATAEEALASKRFLAWKLKMETVADVATARKAYWEEYRSRARRMLLTRFTRCYKAVRERAEAAGTPEWGSLRDAFNIPGMDIHSWTALGMIGRDPVAEFGGLSNDEVAKRLKVVKKELGDTRKTGKVGNLSLLYAMKTLGLCEAAAKNYNIHWSFEEGDSVRTSWLATYIEIDLWHAWKELTPIDSVYIPDPDRGGRYVKKAVYDCRTLADRKILAFGLNAALSYEDQSSGADALGVFMYTMRMKYPKVFETTVNQVHDEVVFQIKDEHVEGYTQIIQDEMVACAEKFTMPFGVHVECSPAIGQVWLKD
jgi:DNA polymerase I-like protein with 3'-5' exonuclease and polymerase domains